MSQAAVSVVIPTLNSARTLGSCLTSITESSSKYEYEIIVVDAGSVDETLEIARPYVDRILYGEPGRINRNIGIEIAKGDIICFTDMIDDRDYEAFVWIKENIGEEYNKAILDPWKATAFTAITGKKVYSRIQRYPKDTDKKATEFLREGCKDTEFLRESDITIVYSLVDCNNPDLIELRPHIYVVKNLE